MLNASITAGEVSDYREAENIIGKIQADIHAVIADRGYDSDAFVAYILSKKAVAVIPARKMRITRRQHSLELYKTRNIIERYFARLKQFRRIATRYDKTSTSFLAAFHAANMCLMLR